MFTFFSPPPPPHPSPNWECHPKMQKFSGLDSIPGFEYRDAVQHDVAAKMLDF